LICLNPTFFLHAHHDFKISCARRRKMVACVIARRKAVSKMVSKLDTNDLMEELAKLAKLRAENVLNDEEYKAVKATMIAGLSASLNERSEVEKPSRGVSNSLENSDDDLIRRIADYERISGILWIGIAILQLISIYGALAGIWNIIAGIVRIKTAKRIRIRESLIPSEFEGVANLVTIGIINLALGGVIGIVFVGFDFFIRDKVLSNRHLFNTTPQQQSPTAIELGAQS
jgi:hypothetical protein